MRASRRTVLAGASAAALAAVLPRTAAATAPIPIAAERRVIEVRGRAATVSGLLQPDGRAGARFRAGDRFRVALTNKLPEPTLIHWHGLRPPLEQDGVPGLSQPLLQPGGVYEYDFALRDAGTYWMHAHHGLQEQTLLAAPLIIAESELMDEQEVVLMLHDFSFRPPEEILASLRSRAAEVTSALMAAQSGGAHSAHGAASQGASGHRASAHGSSAHGQPEAAHEHAMHGGPHLNDVEFDAYLANDRTLADPELVQVERNGRVRLRIINGASSTNFHIDLARSRAISSPSTGGRFSRSAAGASASPCRSGSICGSTSTNRGLFRSSRSGRGIGRSPASCCTRRARWCHAWPKPCTNRPRQSPSQRRSGCALWSRCPIAPPIAA